MENIKELGSVLRKGGFEYKLFDSNHLGYVYAQYDGDRLVSYEVFKRKVNTYFNCVSFPGNEAFGQWAWTYRTLEEALTKFKTFSNETADRN